MGVMRTFPSNRDYSSLSVRDLVEARDHYHVHLAHLQNVVGTAIGRYRIRENDWYATHPPSEKPPEGYERPEGARTLFNSVVTDWSWPCVLVFVDHWADTKSFGTGTEADQIVPRALYLPDGRVVPTCVVEMRRDVLPGGIPHQYRFPKTFIGGGYPVLADVQGRERIGSVGCLVTDGHATFALTNRHVTGEKDREIFSILGGKRVRVGVSDPRHIGKMSFEEVYGGWPGKSVFCNLDAGLIRIDDITHWTTQILGVGPLDEIIDLNTDTMTLDLIDCNVRAFGAASGELFGTIAGFFYRYKSVGGFDYVADVMIAPRPDPADRTSIQNTLPGDSGTVWCLEQPWPPSVPKDDPRRRRPRLRPIALQWGGQVVIDEGVKKSTARSFTLATALSTVCRVLDLDLVRDWNTGLPEYWGAVGHYLIAAIACLNVRDKRLRRLMTANVERISYSRARIEKGANAFKGLSSAPFVGLADVPDFAWKGGGRGSEGPNHFANMDKPVPSGEWKGKTLLDLCRESADNVDVGVWKKYYSLAKPGTRGTLPFRVWQIYVDMKRAVAAGDLNRFVAGAGVLAHYIGDACQPLHLSWMYDGIPQPGGGKKAKGVHEAYEKAMFNKHVAELWDGVKERVAASQAKPIETGKGAAIATVKLMQKAFNLIEPKTIVNAYAKGSDLWAKFADPTKETMANGVELLMHLWYSAWTEGGGDGVELSDDDAELTIGEKALSDIYDDAEGFVPSRNLDEISEFLFDE
jgi:hypothetical protein